MDRQQAAFGQARGMDLGPHFSMNLIYNYQVEVHELGNRGGRSADRNEIQIACS